MTVIAYASGNANVGNSPPVDYTEEHDPSVDLANVALPQNVQVFGNGTDSNDPAPVWTWTWNILSQAEQAPAVILSGNGLVQDPAVQAINSWGNIRLFLIVSNQNTAESSETDPLKAPDSAFVTVRVQSANASIQKPAAGERNWNNDTNEWAAAIESLAGGGAAIHDHNIVDHLDVVDATGADLEALTGGGYADDPDANAPNANGLLHKHHGTDVDVGTTAIRGTVGIESAHTATAINIEVLYWTGHCDGTNTWKGRISQICGVHELGEPDGGIPPWSKNHVDFVNHAAGSLYLKEVHITMAAGGLNAAAIAAANLDAYDFAIMVGSKALWVNNAQGVLLQVTGSPANSHEPMLLSAVNLNHEIPKNHILSVRCVDSPLKDDDVSGLGHGLSVTLKLHRKAGDGV